MKFSLWLDSESFFNCNVVTANNNGKPFTNQQIR